MLVALAIRLGFCAATTGLGESLGEHYREYITAGTRLLQHGSLVSPFILEHTPTNPSAILPPVYAVLVAGVFGAFGVETSGSFLTLQIINALATSLVPLFVFLTASRLAGNKAGWIAACLTLINPTLFGFTTYVWDTSLFALGVSVAVWLALRLGDSPRSRSCFAFGVYLGALALLNPALTAAYPFLVLWPLTKHFGTRWRKIVTGTVIVIAGWLVAITPWTIRNHVHFGELLYVRNGLMIELWLGVCPEADTSPPDAYYSHFPLLNEAAQERISAIGEGDYLEECAAKSRAAIAADPVRFLQLTGVRAVNYWAGTIFSRAYAGRSGIPTTALRRGVTLFLVCETLFIVAALLAIGRWPAACRWLLAAVISFCVVYCFTHVQVRFRAPSEPMMGVLIAVLAARRGAEKQATRR